MAPSDDVSARMKELMVLHSEQQLALAEETLKNSEVRESRFLIYPQKVNSIPSFFGRNCWK